jgi:exodeoxyribonuclease VII small subunit
MASKPATAGSSASAASAGAAQIATPATAPTAAPTAAPTGVEPPAFEATLAQLESLVTRLESGELPLDEALRTFERGVQLTRQCQGALSAAQQKVQLLLQRGETVVIENFNPSEDTDATSRLHTAASE